jgi:hypothetical protein
MTKIRKAMLVWIAGEGSRYIDAGKAPVDTATRNKYAAVTWLADNGYLYVSCGLVTASELGAKTASEFTDERAED